MIDEDSIHINEESEDTTCSSFYSDEPGVSEEANDEKERELTFREKVKKLGLKISYTVIYLKYVYFILIIGVLLAIGLIFSKKEIVFAVENLSNKNESVEEKYTVQTISFAFIIAILCHVVICIILRIIIRLVIFWKEKFNSYIYVAGKITEHVSLGIITLIITGLGIYYKKNFIYAYDDLSFSIHLFEMLFIIFIGNFLMGIVTGCVEFISFKFNRVTFVDRMYYLFRMNYLIKLFKAIRIFRGRSVREEGIWEFGFHWVNLTRDMHPDRIKKSLKYKIILPEDKQGNVNGDYIFKEYQKITNSLLYRKVRDIDIEPRTNSLYKLLRGQGINTIGDLGKYFENQKQFDTLLHNLQLHKGTLVKKYTIRFMLNKQMNETKNLKKSLKQINSALMRIQYALYCIITVFMAVYFFMSAYKEKTLAISLISAFFGTGFAFQSSVKNTLDSIIFLFCIHPYDVGDRVFITLNGQEENLVVSEMNVFSTTFIKFNGSVLYVSNSVLLCKTITNIRRSGMLLEVLRLSISADTDMGRLGMFRVGLSNWVKENERNFGSLAMVNIESIETSVRIDLKVLVQYKRNWHDYIAYLYIKDRLMKELTRLQKVCRIEFVKPLQPIDIVKRKAKKKGVECKD